jgi:ribosomal protein S19
LARAKWKNLYFSNFILKCSIYSKIKKDLKDKNKIIFNKSSTIPVNLLNYKFNIYKGCFFRSIVINKFLLGFKFGVFSFTRKPFKYVLKTKSVVSNIKR